MAHIGQGRDGGCGVEGHLAEDNNQSGRGIPQSVTLSTFLEQLASQHQESPAIIWGARAISFAALFDESRRVARGLAELGVNAGDRVAIWMSNAPAWLAVQFACARLGAILVAVNTRFRTVEVGDIVGRSGAKVLVLWPGFKGIDFLGTLTQLDPASLDRLEAVILYGEGAATCWGADTGRKRIAYAELAGRPLLTADLAHPEGGSNIFTTSGTTKAPKFVLHSHQSVVSHARVVATAFGYHAPQSMTLLGLPLCGIFGFTQAMANLASGRPIIMQASFDAAEAARLIRHHHVTSFHATDEMVARLLAITDDPVLSTSLTWIGFGSFNPILADLPEQAESRGVRLVGLYGSSETQALFARQKLQAPLPERAHAGGFVTAATAAARVRDVATGRLLQPGESGELELKGPSLMLGYYGDEKATHAAFTADGFFRTGDFAHMLSDGSFIFEGRMGDVLRLGGYLVAPSEIEAYVQQHPAIDGCQIVGVSTEHGLAAVGFVTLSPDGTFDEAELREFCGRGLARFKVPAAFFCLDAFPTTQSANGTKVQRAKLREMAADWVTTRQLQREISK
jgi:fatty-acyl-CoA synthase